MLLPLLIFVAGILIIAFFVIWKTPAVSRIPEDDKVKDFIIATKEKIGEEVKKEVNDRVESVLHKVLSTIRKGVIRMEKLTSKWLRILKKRKKQKEEDKPE